MAVHLGFAKKSSKLALNTVPLGKIGGKPLWLLDEIEPNCCSVPCLFICQILAPGNDDFSYYRYLYVFLCPNCRLPSVYRAQLSKVNTIFTEAEEVKTEEEKVDDWNTEVKASEILDLLGQQAPESELNEISLEVYEEDSKVTEVANKLFRVNLKNELEVGEIYEAMEGGVESNSEERMSQGDDDEEEDDLDDIVDDKSNRDVSFDVFRWFNNSCTKSPVIRYGRQCVPLWYSDFDRPVLSPSKCLCGLVRTFEFQVLTQIIPHIKAHDVDFGSIYVFTCPNSCNLQGYVNEEAFVQQSL